MSQPITGEGRCDWIRLLSWLQCSTSPTLLGFLPSQPLFWNIPFLITFLFLPCCVCKPRSHRLAVKVIPSLQFLPPIHESNQISPRAITGISWRFLYAINGVQIAYSLHILQDQIWFLLLLLLFFNLKENEGVEREKWGKQTK